MHPDQPTTPEALSAGTTPLAEIDPAAEPLTGGAEPLGVAPEPPLTDPTAVVAPPAEAGTE